MDAQLGSVEQQFLEAISLECNLTGDTREAFLARFDQKQASKTNKRLEQFISWNKEPVDGAQKLQDELTSIRASLELIGLRMAQRVNNVSQTVRQEIEDTLLLPTAEIKRRRCEKTGL